jgi:hypothetical protein
MRNAPGWRNYNFSLFVLNFVDFLNIAVYVGVFFRYSTTTIKIIFTLMIIISLDFYVFWILARWNKFKSTASFSKVKEGVWVTSSQ